MCIAAGRRKCTRHANHDHLFARQKRCYLKWLIGRCEFKKKKEREREKKRNKGVFKKQKEEKMYTIQNVFVNIHHNLL